ncbi:hypothetical protein GN958_ATG22323 [Phytophthora infestans]|uniref:Uncharacterized protein n=1 Tax=Phytophthora infestans TaxID=4787 RepID=A0A8S9TR95_PHYIN|nr:hypothetical protein GN958_ATG22323 [Phytophthora infestans]
MIEGNRTPNDPSAIFLFCHRHQTLRSLDVPFVKLSVGHAMAKKNEQVGEVAAHDKWVYRKSCSLPRVVCGLASFSFLSASQIMVVTGCEKCFSTFSKLMSASRLRVTWEEWCLK